MDNPRMGAAEFARVREIALALPGVSERTSHGAPCFFVQDKKPLCYYHDNHGSDRRLALWFPMLAGVQEQMVVAEPERFFRPATSASGTFSGWLGVYLDTPSADPDWDEIRAIFDEAFRHVAPRKLTAQLDGRT